MKLYATTTSERASKGQGGEYLDIVITGSYQTELVTLNIKPDGAHYRLTGWTHDNHRIDIKINENMARKGYKDECNGDDISCSLHTSHTKGEKKKGEQHTCKVWVHGKCATCGAKA